MNTNLVRLVEKQTEVCKYDPKFLPSISSLEFPQQFSTHLILQWIKQGNQSVAGKYRIKSHVFDENPICFPFQCFTNLTATHKL